MNYATKLEKKRNISRATYTRVSSFFFDGSHRSIHQGGAGGVQAVVSCPAHLKEVTLIRTTRLIKISQTHEAELQKNEREPMRVAADCRTD